jgi:hypothetical protein
VRRLKLWHWILALSIGCPASPPHPPGIFFVPAGGRLAELAEVREKISEMMAAHWEHWVSQPLPGNPTPMDAVKDPDGREIVESLVLQGERLGPRAAWLASAFCQGQTNVLLTARMPTGRSWSVFALAAAVGPCVVLPHLGPRHLAPAPALFLENGKSLNDLGRTGVAIAITFLAGVAMIWEEESRSRRGVRGNVLRPGPALGEERSQLTTLVGRSASQGCHRGGCRGTPFSFALRGSLEDRGFRGFRKMTLIRRHIWQARMCGVLPCPTR